MELNVRKIKAEMKRQGWRQEDLAARLNITRQAVGYYLAHPDSLSFKTITKLAIAMDMDPKDLLISWLFHAHLRRSAPARLCEGGHIKSMSVSILEIGNFYEAPDSTRVFYTEEGAINAIPVWFKRKDSFSDSYYEDETNERWLTIKTYRVE